METGFSLPAAPQGTALIVHAEIYPTPVVGLAKAAGIDVSAQVAGMVSSGGGVDFVVVRSRDLCRFRSLLAFNGQGSANQRERHFAGGQTSVPPSGGVNIKRSGPLL